jgi:hypothetical protein
MQDRRAHQRFNLRLPVSLFEKNGESKAQVMHSFTRDISSTGAFLQAVPAAPQGSQFVLVLHFSSLLGFGADMTAWAEVVRQESDGLAVAFTHINQTVSGHS